jgi:NAD(P)-dependent dehydrogenase (short-subunit alcohol dehydrogenase family)
MNRFKGKTALITGGTTGIGVATAKLFLNEGARVIVTGRNPATIKAAQAELGNNAIVVPSDATSLPEMDALAKKVKETFGKLDVLFVNAGYGHSPLTQPSRRVQRSQSTEDGLNSKLWAVWVDRRRQTHCLA